MNEPSNNNTIVQIWKENLSVIKHFNNIELKLRSLAIGSYGAFLAAIGFSIKSKINIEINSLELSLAFFLCIGALIVWGAFYFMDRFWYHKLLLGAVKHISNIEKIHSRSLPELGLSISISKASPIKTRFVTIHSSGKFTVFYGAGAIVLIALALVFL